MAKEKLYRIKPELRGYFTEYTKDIHETKDWWNGCWVSDSALEEVADSPKITCIKWTSSYLGASVNDGCTLSFVVIFDGEMYKRWTGYQREKVAKAINDTISPLLVGKTWDELAGEGGKE